ncbi:9926_t:CDS:2 [Acaulospora colombiana]|uniref:9926_t:CDS:1 n=1 Tax=Acaulospora colombiana TaxID=27376 RepID=A0ACA9MKT2_9GLOM|nr:9926_t:CDS:2 [Acaulospora colombiana]
MTSQDIVLDVRWVGSRPLKGWFVTNNGLLLELSKADLGVSDIKDGVVVGHESITQDPELAANIGVTDDATDAGVRTFLDGTKVEGLGHGELLATEGERDFGELSAAREGVESVAESGVGLGLGDLGVKIGDALGVTNDESSSL